MTDGTPLIVTIAGNRAAEAGTLVTPAGLPNIEVRVVRPIKIILVRAVRVFLQTLLGLVTAGLTKPSMLGAKDFFHLLIMCARLSLAPAVVCIIQNIIELMAEFDQTHPTLAG